jgi:hypothetical protein
LAQHSLEKVVAILDRRGCQPIKNSAVTSEKPTSEPFWAVSEQTTSESSQDTIFGNLAELWVGEHCVD